jgi:hypothetical protein
MERTGPQKGIPKIRIPIVAGESRSVNRSSYQRSIKVHYSQNQFDIQQIDAAYQLADDWAGSIMGAAREPELYRFLAQTVKDHKLDFPRVLKAAEYFNNLNLIPQLPRSVLEEKVRTTYEDIEAGQIQRQPAPGSDDDEDDSSPTIWVVPASGERERAKPMTLPVTVRFEPHLLSQQADQVEMAMRLDPKSEPLFSHAGRYATIRYRSSVGDETKPEIFHYSEPALRERMMASAKFFTFRRNKDKGDWVPTKAQDDLVKTLMARNGGNAAPLTGLLLAPTICPNGLAIERPGYHDDTGLYATFDAGSFPKLRKYVTGCSLEDAHWKGQSPRKDILAMNQAMDERDLDLVERTEQRHTSEQKRAQRDAAAAYQWIGDELFGEFPFKHEVDKSAAIAALLTGLVRRTCGPAPAFLISAPQQSTGKTALASVIALASEGVISGLNSWPEKEEELEKILFAALRSGQGTIIFDNCRSGMALKSDKLAKFLTAEVFQGRILGLSELATLPSNALVLLTGNNVMLEGDMASRVVELYLDAHDERPDQRTFKRNIIEWTTDNRASIVEKALTIIKAYLDCGAPATSGKATRFPTWDMMVRRAIVWSGGEDIGAKFDRAHDLDPSLAQLREVMRTWRPALGDEPITAGGIAAKVDSGSADFSDAVIEFRKALCSLLGIRSGAVIDGTLLSKRLARYASRPLNGMRIVNRHDKGKNQMAWQIETIGRSAEDVFE